MLVCATWLARDFLRRARRPLDIPPCTHRAEMCPPIRERNTEMTTETADLNTDPMGFVILTETQNDFTEPGTWAPDWDGLLHTTIEAAKAEATNARGESEPHGPVRVVACYHPDLVPGLLDELAKTRAELDEIKGKIAHPTVKGVMNLVDLCEERWHRAEAAHDAKDEANRRWLESENGLKSAWEEIEYWRTKHGLPTPTPAAS